MAGRKGEKQKGLREDLKFEAYGLVLLTFALISLIGYGKMRYVSFLFFLLAGSWGFLISLFFAGWGLYLMVRRRWMWRMSSRWVGTLLLLLAVLLLAQLHFYEESERLGLLNNRHIVSFTWDTLWSQQADYLSGQPVSDVGGGMIGAFAFALFSFFFDVKGTKLVVLLFILLGILLLTNRSYVRGATRFYRWMTQRLKALKAGIANKMQTREQRRQARTGQKKDNGTDGLSDDTDPLDMPQAWETEPAAGEPLTGSSTAFPAESPEPSPVFEEPVEQGPAERNRDNTFRTGPDVFERENDNRPQPMMESPVSETVVVYPTANATNTEYQLPSASLLRKGKKPTVEKKQRSLNALAKKLEQTLDSFGVRAKVTQVHSGPAVTRFELQPEAGVKVSRIVSLADDMALALAAKDIRIEAPIPGKSALGIEVPNQEISIVTLREVIESEPFQQSEDKLLVALGKDISGEPVVGNLSKMPHVLVAGATGSGKSVCINGMIVSLLYRARPDEVKFLMIDPKMVELSVYNEIPHLLIPVVTDPRKASAALKKVVHEMENRYQLFAKAGTRDIERYNQLMEMQGQEKLPYIVVIIDELADLMMVAPGDVEEAISRLAQMARAAGIHLIIATQRPSVDVITGLIKANIPSRIAFGVSSQVDSRTILDMAGAEKLLGRGDMLYYPVGYPKPVRVQGAFISDREVEAVVAHVKSQQRPEYREDMLAQDAGQSDAHPEEEDELFETAMRLVIETQQASVSLLQRRLHIGYTRAARLIDALESHGVIGPYEGSKPREVLIKPDQVSEVR